jgi:hypothetical protein
MFNVQRIKVQKSENSTKEFARETRGKREKGDRSKRAARDPKREFFSGTVHQLSKICR